MSKRILGLNGSHREQSNSSHMLAAALEVCQERGYEVEQVDLSGKEIGYCTVCDVCKKAYACPLADDVWDIMDAIGMADGIIVATPTYFGDMSSKLKAFFDRTLPARRNGMLFAGKFGAALATGAARNGGQEHAIRQIHTWMLLQQMAIVADRKTAHFGGICMSSEPGSVLDDSTGLSTVVNTAENLCEMLGGP